jgi:Transglycosylase-like domain
MRQIILFSLACALALALTARSAPAQASQADHQRVLRKIAYYRTAAWRWQTLTMHSRTPSSGAAWRRHNYRFRLHVLHGWRRRAAVAWRVALHPPNVSSWECIHQGEGAWRSNTGNGYYGGLQMDLGFQQAYGAHLLRRKGTADHWTPLEQIWVAETARRSGRGFYPWPNTARVCGLI